MGGIGGTLGGLGDSIGSYWAQRGPHYHADPYQIDPTAFVNPQADANRTAWAKAASDANAAGPGFFGTEQQNLVNDLKARANGQTPSIARAALKAATDRNLAQAAGLQSSARGVNPALTARNVANTQATMAQEAAGQGTQAELAERLAAQNQLAQAISEGRGQDLTQRGQNLETGLGYAGLENNQDIAGTNAAISGQQLGVENTLGTNKINADASNNNNQLGLGLLGTALSTGGGVLGSLAGSGGAAAGGGGAGVAAAALAHGGVVPGPDAGHDDKLIAARGGEVVVNPENPEYARAKAAVAPGAPFGGGMPLPGPMQGMGGGAPAPSVGRRILQWIKSGASSAGQILDSSMIGNPGGLGMDGHPDSSGSSASVRGGSNAYRVAGANG